MAESSEKNEVISWEVLKEAKTFNKEVLNKVFGGSHSLSETYAFMKEIADENQRLDDEESKKPAAKPATG